MICKRNLKSDHKISLCLIVYIYNVLKYLNNQKKKKNPYIQYVTSFLTIVNYFFLEID